MNAVTRLYLLILIIVSVPAIAQPPRSTIREQDSLTRLYESGFIFSKNHAISSSAPQPEKAFKILSASKLLQQLSVPCLDTSAKIYIRHPDTAYYHAVAIKKSADGNYLIAGAYTDYTTSPATSPPSGAVI